MGIPGSTDETRRRGCEASARLRCERRALGDKIAAGTVTPSEAMRRPAMSGCRASVVLTYIPGIDRARALSILDGLGISRAARVRALGCHQRYALSKRANLLQREALHGRR